MNKVLGKIWAECPIGTTAEFEIIVTEKMVQDFAVVSGDVNPLHLDAGYAATTPYGKQVAHGLFGGALFSRLIGTQLPGKTTVYLSQTLFFRNPIFLGTAVRVKGEVIGQTEAVKTIKIKTTIFEKNSGVVLTDGEALVKFI